MAKLRKRRHVAVLAFGGDAALRRDQVIAYIAIGIVAAYAAFTLLARLHDGRCRPGGPRGGFSCTYPSAAGSRRLTLAAEAARR
jgi:hypothetical protein